MKKENTMLDVLKNNRLIQMFLLITAIISAIQFYPELCRNLGACSPIKVTIKGSMCSERITECPFEKDKQVWADIVDLTGLRKENKVVFLDLTIDHAPIKSKSCPIKESSDNFDSSLWLAIQTDDNEKNGCDNPLLIEYKNAIVDEGAKGYQSFYFYGDYTVSSVQNLENHLYLGFTVLKKL